MSKFKKFSKISFISIIILIIYIPLFFLLIFSFNKTTDKGTVVFDVWNGFSTEAYQQLFSQDVLLSFANSTIIAILTTLITTTLSLLTVFALWKQKNKITKTFLSTTNNIPVINPDVITAIGVGIILTIFFGTLLGTQEGLWRAVASHVVLTLPYSILVMYPRSEKFNATLFKASYDLGYGKIKTWFKTYFVYMLISMFFSGIITIVFSFDDFILARITSNVSTVGVQLFAGDIKPWALAIGSILLISVLIGNISYILYITKKNKIRKIGSKNEI